MHLPLLRVRTKQILDERLCEFVGRLEGLVDPLKCSDLQSLIEELRTLEKNITAKLRNVAEIAARAAHPTSKLSLPTPVITRSPTITMKLPTFDGKMVQDGQMEKGLGTFFWKV